MASDIAHERLQATLRGLAFGAEPTRLLHDALAGAVAATKAREGVLMRVQNGAIHSVASTGSAGQYLAEAARDAIKTERMVRRRDDASGMVAAAEPIRAGSRVLGAIVVGGGMQSVEVTPLSLFADAAALVLLRQPVAAGAAVPELLDTLSLVASSMDTATTMGHIFDAATRMFGATSGFCALADGSTMRIAAYRGLEQDRLVGASRRPEFKALLADGDIRVDAPTNAAVSELTRLGEFAVSLPLGVGGQPSLGRLVLFLADPPDPARTQLLQSFATNVSLSVRAASLYRRIEDHEEQLASMVHAMANPIVVVDEAGKILELNGAACELFRLSAAFEVGQTVAGKLGHAGLEGMVAPGANDGAQEVVLPGANDGEPRVYRATVRRMRSNDGRALGRVLVLDDLTTEREADAIKADFVAVIGHELRTPLTVMKGYVHTLVKRHDTLSEEKRAQALGAVQQNLSRLERLIEDLLFISSVEQRRCKVDLESLDLAALLNEREVNERVTVRVPRRPVEMLVDRSKLDQVLHHLLDNALKYSEGQVVLELADKGDSVEVSVTDSGPGIYSGDVPQLFERFRQLDGTSTRQHGGVGIGLYLSRRVVEALGGRIWCDSRLGVGSRFAFILPKDGPVEPAASIQTNALAQ